MVAQDRDTLGSALAADLDRELGRAPPIADDALDLPDRYQLVHELGRGGVGVVWRAVDRRLDRDVAIKILRAGAAVPAALFEREARLTARLQHPGILPVYDVDRTASGRLFYVMRLALGRPYRPDVRDEPSLARAVGWLARACDAVGFAHRRGVVHGDLKPANLLVGDHGEVLVVDWGFARVLGDGDDRFLGGTPGFVAPEALIGAPIDTRADVWALGAILYETLTGAPVHDGDTDAVLAATVAADAADPRLRAPGTPDELAAVCLAALSRRPEARPADAGALADRLRAWLEGQDAAADARRRVAAAAVARSRAEHLAERAEACARAARAHLASLPADAPIEARRDGWALEDRAIALERAAARRTATMIRLLHGALARSPGLAEAHAALARHYRDALERALARGDSAAAADAEALLRVHDRGEHATFLAGDGALSVASDPPGACARAYRYVARDRRLVPVLERDLGPTPVIDARLPHGSYVVTLEHPGRATVRVPVVVPRGGAARVRAPGAAGPHPIALPATGELGDDDVYVPAGWARLGGDPLAPDAGPGTDVWVDGFVIRRHPVTHAEYVAFLDALHAAGRGALAAACVPRLPASEGSAPVYVRAASGRWALDPARTPRPWSPRTPVVLIDWHAARAYAAWLAERTGLPWRLPTEREREKAARGADGRAWPWGDHFEPTWARCAATPGDAPYLGPVDEPVADESPYGMRGAAGNVRDWCADRWDDAAPDDDRAAWRVVRGGAWNSVPAWCRAAARFADPADRRFLTIGFRVARSWPTAASAPPSSAPPTTTIPS